CRRFARDILPPGLGAGWRRPGRNRGNVGRNGRPWTGRTPRLAGADLVGRLGDGGAPGPLRPRASPPGPSWTPNTCRRLDLTTRWGGVPRGTLPGGPRLTSPPRVS